MIDARPASLLVVAVLLAGCAGDGMPGATTSSDDIHLWVDATLAPPAVRALRRGLQAPVQYLGRPETPFRVTMVADAEAGALRRAATVVVVENVHGRSPAGLAAWWRTAPVARDSFPTQAGHVTWARYDNLSVSPQTVQRARVAATLDSVAAHSLATALRADLEASLVSHRLRQLRQETGAVTLAPRVGAGAFTLLVPAGYSWSDTARGWPHSLQMFASGPTRGVSVFWLEEAKASWITSPEFLLGFLGDAMWRLHGDRLPAGSVVWDAPGAASLHGVWQNPQAIAGGPQWTRFVYDARRQRLYGVQAMVFHPGADKHRTLREVIAVASSFAILE